MKYINKNFKCILCKYGTDDKSNYNKHVKSKGHVDKVKQDQLTIKYPCEYCNRIFNKKCNLTRHTLTCQSKGTNVEELKKHYEHIIEIRDIELKHAHQKIDELQNDKKDDIKPNITYINGDIHLTSVKNYVQHHYPDAPPLIGLGDYSVITYDEETNKSDDDFISTLVYNYNHKYLSEFLGQFLIKHYKMEDPSRQSVWNSDISRLTYVVKELLANKKTVWNQDCKGVKTKEYIVTPLLDYIKSYIDKFWVDSLDNHKKLKGTAFAESQNIYNTLYKIKIDIETDVLGNDIIKYIAPYFRTDKNNKITNTKLLTNAA